MLLAACPFGVGFWPFAIARGQRLIAKSQKPIPSAFHPKMLNLGPQVQLFHQQFSTMNKPEIRKVTLEDLPRLRSLAVRTFTESFSGMNTGENMQQYLSSAFTAEKLADELSRPGAEFYFALVDERVAGYLKVNTGQAQTELREENGLEIERIYVLQEFQGQKIGQQLFDKARQIAKQKKCGFMWLGVWEENTKAIQFYRKNGFEVFDKHIFKLGGDEQTDLMMKLEMDG